MIAKIVFRVFTSMLMRDFFFLWFSCKTLYGFGIRVMLSLRNELGKWSLLFNFLKELVTESSSKIWWRALDVVWK